MCYICLASENIFQLHKMDDALGCKRIKNRKWYSEQEITKTPCNQILNDNSCMCVSRCNRIIF